MRSHIITTWTRSDILQTLADCPPSWFTAPHFSPQMLEHPHDFWIVISFPSGQEEQASFVSHFLHEERAQLFSDSLLMTGAQSLLVAITCDCSKCFSQVSKNGAEAKFCHAPKIRWIED